MEAKRKNIRKRRVVETEDDEEPTEDVELRTKLEEAKALQKLRARTTGLSADLLAHGVRKVEEPVAPVDEPGVDLLEAYVKERVQEGSAADPQMEKYIEEEMARRLGKTKEEDVDDVELRRRKEEEELYRIPDNLKGQSIQQTDVAAYMTGILEVPLPVDFKMRNIEETEQAKKMMLEKVNGFRGLDDDEGGDGAEDARGPRRGLYPREFGWQGAKVLAQQRRTEETFAQPGLPAWKDKKKKRRK